MKRVPSGASPRLANAVAVLRGNRERVTPARYAVLRVIEAADLSAEHLSADAIGARVAELEPRVHRATVYRTLSALTEAGILTHVHLSSTGTVYHLADQLPAAVAYAGVAGVGSGGETAPSGSGVQVDDVAAAAHLTEAAGADAVGDAGQAGGGHAHVQCIACGLVLDVPPSVLLEAALRLRADLGFALDTSHAALLGRCRDCLP